MPTAGIGQITRSNPNIFRIVNYLTRKAQLDYSQRSNWRVGIVTDDGLKVKPVHSLDTSDVSGFLQNVRPENITRILTVADETTTEDQALAIGDEVTIKSPVTGAETEVWAVNVIPHERRVNGRPGFFYKGNPRTVVGPEQTLRIRADSEVTIPEPELTLVSTSNRVVGLTIGNDMSAIDIISGHPDGYRSQGKVYCGSCSIGPAIIVGATEEVARDFQYGIKVERGEQVPFSSTGRIGDRFDQIFSLRDWLCKGNGIPLNYLLTGSLALPPPDFKLVSGDTVEINISGIGTLRNPVRKNIQV